MPYLSSDLCGQMFLYNPSYFSGEDKLLYPEDISDKIFYVPDSCNIEKEGFNLESEPFDSHFIGDELSYNEYEQAISKNAYFNYFWGENKFFSLKSSGDRSYAGEMQKSETLHPDEEQAIWRDYNYNPNNVEMLNNLNYESPCEDELQKMSFWKNCYECFDDVHSGNDDLYGYIADEGLSEWLFGNVKYAQRLEAAEQSPGYGEVAVATKLFLNDEVLGIFISTSLFCLVGFC